MLRRFKSHRTCVGCFGETYCSTLTSSREHLTTQTDAGSGMSIPTARNVASAGSEWQRGLIESTAHARVPSQSQSVFTSRREQSILCAPPVNAVWRFGDGDFLSTAEAKILCAPSVSL
ncbi:hypothetical protein TNCV_4534441 [Trichonephila clavipes]|nr:hypothetical protein TNCV_4534441 [Trichonephila clavipes]